MNPDQAETLRQMVSQVNTLLDQQANWFQGLVAVIALFCTIIGTVGALVLVRLGKVDQKVAVTNERMEGLDSNWHACQEEGTSERRRIWERLDQHGERITRLEVEGEG